MDVDTATYGVGAAPPSASSTSAPAFTVVAQGVPFVLSRAQCEYDSPNHFTASFCGDFEEATTKTLYTDRSPILFEFIVQHLSDYDVLPLPSLPTMSPEAALQNLLHDAQYFGLSKLEAEIAPLIEHSRGPAALESVGYARRISLATLTSGASSLERNTAMWASEVSGVTGKGRLVPLAGDRLPPLVRVTEVNLVIDWEDSFQTGITLGIASPALDAAIVVPAKKDTPPLTIQQKSYCFFYAEDLDSPYMGAERPIEPERPDPTITIDGHQVTMDRFRKSLALWGPNLPPPPPDLSPFDNALYRHLNSTRVTRDFDERWSTISFTLFADEIWVAPTQTEVTVLSDGSSRLDQAGWSLVAARCRSRASILDSSR